MDKKEIALVVPSIEPWNQNDEIHFGDAGEGRAVAWVRFGTAINHKNLSNEEMKRVVDAMPGIDTWYKSPANENRLGKDIYYPSTEENKSFRDCIIDNGNGLFEINGPCANKYLFKQQMGNKEKVLVIDEIQSKRHQDALKKVKVDGQERKMGYTPRGVWTERENLNVAKKAALTDYYDLQKAIRDEKGWGDKAIPDEVMQEWKDEYPELAEKEAQMKNIKVNSLAII